ncbi:hypothetical protein Tco_0454746, partial [Tanacetum coccineum]
MSTAYHPETDRTEVREPFNVRKVGGYVTSCVPPTLENDRHPTYHKTPIDQCMTRSSTKELITPFKDPKREFRSSRKHFKTLSLDESRSPNFDLFSEQEEYSEEEVAETMAETVTTRYFPFIKLAVSVHIPVIPTETPIIAPTLPPSPDYTPASPDYSPASDSEYDLFKDPSSDHIPPLPAISPFLSSDDDTTNSDTPDTPPSPTHGTPFTEITASTQRSPIIPHRQVMILSPRQPIPHGRPYRYHLNGPIHMMTVRKRVGPLPTHRLAVRHSANHSSLDSSSEASSDFHSNASFDSSSRHSLSDHSSPDLLSTSVGPSRKRSRSPMTSVPALSPVSGALSPVRANLIPSPKRVKDSGYLADVEVDLKEISLRDNAIIRVSDEPHLEHDSDPEIQAEID